MNSSSALMRQLWQGLSEPSALTVQKALSDLVLGSKSELAGAFYSFMMEDPAAAQFLAVKAVEARLKPGLERWLERLFCHQNSEELEAVLAMQRHIGEVHARAEIPVHLVARGMRLLKREIITSLLKTNLSRDHLIDAVLRTDRLIDVAFEEMSAAFVHSHDADVRVDEAYRMFASGHNLALEREKQFRALLEWENRLFRSVATDLPLDQLSTLSNSAFGLWLHHKAALIFDETRELPLIDESMRRIDEMFFPQIAHSRDQTLQSEEVRSLVMAVMVEMEQLKFLFASMFERLTDLEVGRDVLTQLFNRRFLQTILKREIELNRRKKSPFCVLMLDIDIFKRVNDQHGHDAGDRVLQGIAGLLIHQVRASDFVFRYGGEEFLIVLAEVDGLQAQEVAEKICRRVEATEVSLSDAKTIKVTLSIGIAEFDGHPDYQRMIDRADKALYAAKNGGRNRWVLAQEHD
jgi:diguanylate cyclase